MSKVPKVAQTGRGKRSLDVADDTAVPSSKAPRAAGGWKQGQIYRVRLHNFLTFDDVQFCPSPHLNVIVGPNGTGKSSIVCAMCIGLGGHPSLLGRAKELKDFIKQGKVEGWVELELFNERGRNWVVRRIMSNHSNTSSWMLNGKEVRKKEVEELTNKLHIQLDNKCQFLPQDMVVEFAKMNAATLLEETEKAIGPKDLYANHLKLKELKDSLLKSHHDYKEKNKQRESEVSKNQLLERDVERFRDRQNFIARIKHLKMKKCWLEYANGREDFLKAKEARKEAVKKYRMVHHEYGPIEVKHREQEEAVKRFKEGEKTAKQVWRKAQRQVQLGKERLEKLEEDLEGPRQELEEKKKDELKRRKKIDVLNQEIQAFQKELEKMENPSSLQPQIAEKQTRLRAIQREVGDLRPERLRVTEQREELVSKIRRCEDELKQMQSVRNQRLNLLQRVDRETYEAVLWLEKNRHLFKDHIFEPILLSVNVRDASYTAQIEAVLSGKDFFSFVTLNQEDKSMLIRELRDNRNLRINVVLAPNRPLSSFQPETPLHVLRRYGLTDLILDMIDAPEPILAFYCQFHFLHQVPLAKELSPQQLQKVMDDLKGVRRFFTQNTQHMLTRSRYANKVNMRTSTLMPPRFLTANIDSQRKAELEQEIQEAQRAISEVDENYQELQQREDILHREDSKLRTEKNKLRLKVDHYKQTQSNISSRETRLREVQTSSFDLEAEEQRCEEAMEAIQRKRIEAVKVMRNHLEESKVKLVEQSKAKLLVSTAVLRVSHLMYQYRQAKERLETAEQEKQAKERRETELKSRVQSLLQRARNVSGVQNPEENPELMRTFGSFPDDLDAVEEKIHEYQAQADLCMGIDEETVREYEEREEKIKRLDEQLKRMDELCEKGHGEVEKLKEEWLTPLRDMLKQVSQKFSEYFSHMKCVGEVALHEDGNNFSHYAVKISVKFRDSEELQALNAQRQSGGERSVSTMLYLMALQGITACPFRVVDEINQGMDPVNERRVFDLIVAATSTLGDHSSQYFILTPKLLRDLAYTDAVTVHVVYNGQEMPQFRQWNLASFLE